MVLDLKQIVSTHIVELDTHTLDTAVERVEKSIFPRSLDQNASYEELARELSKCSPLESRVLLETLSEHTEGPISNRATSVQPAAVVSKQQEDLARWFHPDPPTSMNDSVQGDWTGRGRLKGSVLGLCRLTGLHTRLGHRSHRRAHSQTLTYVDDVLSDGDEEDIKWFFRQLRSRFECKETEWLT